MCTDIYTQSSIFPSRFWTFVNIVPSLISIQLTFHLNLSKVRKLTGWGPQFYDVRVTSIRVLLKRGTEDIL